MSTLAVWCTVLDYLVAPGPKLWTLNALHHIAFHAGGRYLPHTCLIVVGCCYSAQHFSAHLPDCNLQSYIWLRLQPICVCRELLYQGDRDTILEVLSWIFEQDQQQAQVLQKRAHVGFYLSGLEVGAASSAAKQQPCRGRSVLGRDCIYIATLSAASVLSSLV